MENKGNLFYKFPYGKIACGACGASVPSGVVLCLRQFTTRSVNKFTSLAFGSLSVALVFHGKYFLGNSFPGKTKKRSFSFPYYFPMENNGNLFYKFHKFIL